MPWGSFHLRVEYFYCSNKFLHHPKANLITFVKPSVLTSALIVTCLCLSRHPSWGFTVWALGMEKGCLFYFLFCCYAINIPSCLLLEITFSFSFEFSYYFWQFQPCIECTLFTPSQALLSLYIPSVPPYPHNFLLFPVWFIFVFLLRSVGLLSLVSMDIASPTRPRSWWLLPQDPSAVPSSPKSPSPSQMARKSLHAFFYSGPAQATTVALSSGL